MSEVIEENKDREINKLFWGKFMKLSKDKSAERKSFTQTGLTVKARLLLEGTWYVSSRPLNKSNYRREGTDASRGVKSYVGAEVFLDDDVHPYWLAYYGKEGTREEFKEYHELFIRNTDFGSGMAKLNQKLLSNVKRALEESEKHSDMFERWKREAEEKETEAKSELREAFFKDFSLPSNPSGSFDRKEFFRKWYRESFLKDDYGEKIEKTRKTKSRAFKKWVKNFRKKLERKGFRPVDEENQSR